MVICCCFLIRVFYSSSIIEMTITQNKHTITITFSYVTILSKELVEDWRVGTI